MFKSYLNIEVFLLVPLYLILCTFQASVSSGPTLSSGKTIQGVRTAIVLPGIGDLAANKSKVNWCKGHCTSCKSGKNSEVIYTL